MKYLPLIWSYLRRRKMRTALTLLSILIAFLLYGYLCAIRESLNAGVSVAGADRLVTRHKVSIIQFLPESYKAQMESISGVAAVVHCTWFGGIYKDQRNFFAQIPVQPEPFLQMYPEYLLPEEQKKNWLETRTGAVAGRTIAEK
jgi:putative ABC transport system permease protein